MRRKLITACLALFLGTASLQSSAESELPSIGGSGYSVISTEQEYRLGRAWARMLRGSTRIYTDAVVSQYAEDLTWSLVKHSELTDRRLDVLVLDNPVINAFAAPGGVIGVHTGLLLTAKNEAQLASVLSHELAHLSQRHFAAQLEEERRNRPFFLASLLGSILLAAADPEAGVAGLQTSLAASASAKLSFSRQNEREADYIGMRTLTNAGYDPMEMANMFRELQKSARFSRIPPEFLLTHPVTQSRISDALNRAEQSQPLSKLSHNIDFSIAKVRIQVNYSKDLAALLKKYQNHQNKNGYADSSNYAITYAALKQKRFDLAERHLKLFNQKFKRKLIGKLLEAELLIAKEQYGEAEKILSKLRAIYPSNHAVNFISAENLIFLNQAAKASEIYETLLENNPNDSRAWYLLAESYGLEGNIIGVHEARIEYFLLTANVDKALRQVDFALKEPYLTDNERARLEQRKIDAKKIRESLKLDL